VIVFFPQETVSGVVAVAGHCKHATSQGVCYAGLQANALYSDYQTEGFGYVLGNNIDIIFGFTAAARRAALRPGAPSGLPRLSDDVLAAADDVYQHGYDYHPRIRARGVEDPVGHNFPYSFDDEILNSTPVLQTDGSLLYQATGTLNGKEKIYEIAVNPDTNTIFHRTLRTD